MFDIFKKKNDPGKVIIFFFESNQSKVIPTDSGRKKPLYIFNLQIKNDTKKNTHFVLIC